MNETLRKIVRESVREGVDEALTRYGMDISDAAAMQADMLYLRKSRLGSDEVIKWMRRSVFTAAFSGLLAALWVGLKHLLKGD